MHRLAGTVLLALIIFVVLFMRTLAPAQTTVKLAVVHLETPSVIYTSLYSGRFYPQVPALQSGASLRILVLMVRVTNMTHEVLPIDDQLFGLVTSKTAPGYMEKAATPPRNGFWLGQGNQYCSVLEVGPGFDVGCSLAFLVQSGIDQNMRLHYKWLKTESSVPVRLPLPI